VEWSLALGKDQTMKRKRHTEEQIIAILKEHEARMKTADLCRKHGISEGCFYNWKANEEWRADYNTERSHSRLGWMSPSTYAAARRPPGHHRPPASNSEWIKKGGSVKRYPSPGGF
jgi:hypothetical protein